MAHAHSTETWAVGQQQLLLKWDVSYFLMCWRYHHVRESVTAWREEDDLSNGHIFLYYTNYDLIFYFSLFYVSIKCVKKEELY